MSSKFNVVFTGLQEGVTEEQFVARFCQKFGISETKARKISASASDVTIKKDLQEDKARQYLAALESCGMIARLDEITAEPEPDSGLSLAPIEEETVETSDKTVCPKCGSDQIEDDECQACGIYISKYLADKENSTITHDEEFASQQQSESTSDADNPYATPGAELTDSDELLGPEKVAIGSGIYWLSRGFWHFKQNPFAWIGAFVVFLVSFFILALIPFLGGIMTNLLSPVFMAGFALGADEQQEGGDFRVGHLFAGFSNNVWQLMLVGVFYLLGVVVLVVVAAVLMGGTMAASGMTEGAGMDPNAMAALMEPGMLIMMLVISAVVILLTMAYYYAPILIVLEGMNAWGAMAMSFRACLKNWLAFIVYGLLLMVLLFVASIPFFLGLLIAIPMVQAAIYVSYRDIFHHEY